MHTHFSYVTTVQRAQERERHGCLLRTVHVSLSNNFTVNFLLQYCPTTLYKSE